MITIFTALYPEAKELIRALSLKKDMTQKHFQVFSDEKNQIQIVITGVSAIAVATAVAECSTRREPDSGDFLINYGSCAGGKNIPVGTVSLCNKLTEAASGRTFYPDILYRHPFEETELYSFPSIQGTNVWKRFEDARKKNDHIEKKVRVDMEAAAIYQAGNYYYAPHQMLFVKVVTDHGTGSVDNENGQRENFSQIMDRACEQFLPFIRQLLAIQEKSSEQKEKQEAFRCQVEEETNLWSEALHGSETMKAQIRQMMLYHSLQEPDGESGKTSISDLYKEYEQAGCLPAKDKREGKKILEELRAQLL